VFESRTFMGTPGIFDLKERDRRWSNTRREMEGNGLDGLLVVSDGQLERRGSLRYISDIGTGLWYGYVLFPLRGEPIAINVQGEWIKETRMLPIRGGWVSDSEPYAPTIAEAILDLNLDTGRIGIEGDFIPAPVYRRLVKELPKATFRFSNIIHELKMVKGPTELMVVEQGVEMVDKAFEACLEFAQTGKTWNDITSEVFRALYHGGAEDIGGYPLSRSIDIIKTGDSYHLYPETQAPGGYWMQFGRLISFGEPDKELQAAWELDMKAQEKGAEKVRPGNTGADVMKAINDALKGSQYTGAPRGSGHGVGLDVIERPYITLDDETVIKPGMVIAVHPVFMPHPAAFEAAADMFIVTEGKPRKLSRISQEIKVV
jgi:Xaa-Pro aminopeptidase